MNSTELKDKLNRRIFDIDDQRIEIENMRNGLDRESFEDEHNALTEAIKNIENAIDNLNDLYKNIDRYKKLREQLLSL